MRRDCARVTSTAEVQRDRVQVVHPPRITPGPTTLTPQDAEDVNEDNDGENGAPAAALPGREKLPIRVPDRYRPRA